MPLVSDSDEAHFAQIRANRKGKEDEAKIVALRSHLLNSARAGLSQVLNLSLAINDRILLADI